MKRLLFGGALLLILPVALVVVASTSCDDDLPLGNPALPPGFQDALVVELDFNAYVYVRQGAPFALSMRHFGEAPEPTEGDDTSVGAGVDHLSVFVGDSLATFGGTVEFSQEADAEQAMTLLDLGRSPARATRSGSRLLFAGSSGSWSDTLALSVADGYGVALSQRYPEAWDAIRWLPENPPSPPVAAGFFRLKGFRLESAATRVGIELGGLNQALGFFRLGDMAFAVYSDKPLQIPGLVDKSFLEESGVSAMLVARSGYPGWVASIGLSVLGDRVDLEKVDVGGTAFRYRKLDNLHLFLHRRGRVLFAAVSADRAAAEALIQSIL